MHKETPVLLIFIVLFTILTACSGGVNEANQAAMSNASENEAEANVAIDAELIEVMIPENSEEPILVTGTIPFTSRFFLNSASEPFVMLEDQAGFVARDLHFEFPLEGQVIGPVSKVNTKKLKFSLSLPSQPQGTLLDVDNNGQEDAGLMIFAVAYWSNTWGDPFLESREGTGWSSAHASTITDPDRDYEISGGHLIIWAPDDTQGFPSGFGEDGLLFTEDDPIQTVPAGYNIVDLNAEPFAVYKEVNPQFELSEGASQVKDYSDMNYVEAFDEMFERVSIEYPFTADKGVDWDTLYTTYQPLIVDANSDTEFYSAMKSFTLEIPDKHIGLSFDAQVFWEQVGGSFGLLFRELSDGRVIVTEVIPSYTGETAGIELGAEIITWDGQPVADAIGEVTPWLGSFSTDHDLRREQTAFLTRMPIGEHVEVVFQNPGGPATTADLAAVEDYDSFFASLWYFNEDPIALPIEIEVLDAETVDSDESIAYIKITTFSDDYNLMAQIWNYQMNLIGEEEIDKLIIDMRTNGGGNGGLALDFVGYFFEQEVELSHRSYYSHASETFEFSDWITTIEPAPSNHFGGEVVILVGDDCVSACEGFAAAMSASDKVTIVGHTPTAGAFGEVGRGQYTMPGDYDMQFPTGRPETFEGELYIEGIGVVPDIIVPITYESALGQIDAVLQAAIDFLLGR